MQSVQVKMAHDQELVKPRYRGFFHAMYLMGKEDKFKGLFDGLNATVIKGFINNAIRFSVYNEIKQSMLAKTGAKDLSMDQAYLAGAVAGGVSAFVTHPLDVVRTNLQGLNKDRFRGVSHCLSSVLKESGVKGLYKVREMLSIFISLIERSAIHKRYKKKLLSCRDSLLEA